MTEPVPVPVLLLVSGDHGRSGTPVGRHLALGDDHDHRPPSSI